MSTLSLRLPRSLHRQLRELARREGVSMNQLISSAVAEKIAALATLDYLKERGARGDREAFLRALSKVPDAEALEGDQLDGQAEPPNKRLRRTRKLGR